MTNHTTDETLPAVHETTELWDRLTCLLEHHRSRGPLTAYHATCELFGYAHTAEQLNDVTMTLAGMEAGGWALTRPGIAYQAAWSS